MRFFRKDVDARHIPKSVTGVQDIRSAQIYFGIAGAPEIWTDIRRSDGAPYLLKENEFLLKTGYHDENTGRYGHHVSEYGFFRLSDSVVGKNPRLAEQKFKGWLRNENLLLSARHVNKTTRDTELIAVTLVRYKEAVGKAIDFVKESSAEDKLVDIDYERELTKRMEEETKRIQTNSEIRKAELETEVKKLQIELEVLKLSQTGHAKNAPRRPEPPLPRPATTMDPAESVEDTPYSGFIRESLIKTQDVLDRISYAEISSRCQVWMTMHRPADTFDSKLLRATLERYFGRKYGKLRDLRAPKTAKGEHPQFKGWDRVKIRV